MWKIHLYLLNVGIYYPGLNYSDTKTILNRPLLLFMSFTNTIPLQWAEYSNFPNGNGRCNKNNIVSKDSP